MAYQEFKLNQPAEEVQEAIDNALIAVTYGDGQKLTPEQKEQARINIGAAATNSGIDGGAVLYDSEQALENAQKARARTNIGAVSEEYVTAAINTALGDYPTALSELDEVIGGES